MGFVSFLKYWENCFEQTCFKHDSSAFFSNFAEYKLEDMAKKKKVEDKTSVKSLINAAGLKDLPQGDTIRFVVGAILLLIAILMLLAFTSNFITGPMDQAHVESSDLDRAQNYGGRLGAYLAYFFMNDCFGICAYFIPIFLLLASMKLMKAYKVRLWKWFIYCTILCMFCLW